jgi:hypothetical protein
MKPDSGEVIPYEEIKRTAKRGAAVGTVVALVGVVVLGDLGDSPRRVAGMLLMALSGGAGLGAGVWLRGYSWGPDRPESKARTVRLILLIGVTSMAGVVLAGFVAGVMGR